MRLLIIRHGDPDYALDSLTSAGRIEAALLADYLKDVTIDHAYASPLGRAQETARPTLAAKGIEATTLDWLREFSPVERLCAQTGRTLDDFGHDPCIWDRLPGEWTTSELFFGEHWYEEPSMAAVDAKGAYEDVCAGLDALLAKHGYVRMGRTYRAERPNHDTIALFTHFGLGCTILSHLLGISPVLLWHGLVAAPSSVTTLWTEERRQGVAWFRMAEYGGVAHLARADVSPSFAARFCECFEDKTLH